MAQQDPCHSPACSFRHSATPPPPSVHSIPADHSAQDRLSGSLDDDLKAWSEHCSSVDSVPPLSESLIQSNGIVDTCVSSPEALPAFSSTSNFDPTIQLHNNDHQFLTSELQFSQPVLTQPPNLSRDFMVVREGRITEDKLPFRAHRKTRTRSQALPVYNPKPSTQADSYSMHDNLELPNMARPPRKDRNLSRGGGCDHSNCHFTAKVPQQCLPSQAPSQYHATPQRSRPAVIRGTGGASIIPKAADMLDQIQKLYVLGVSLDVLEDDPNLLYHLDAVRKKFETVASIRKRFKDSRNSERESSFSEREPWSEDSSYSNE